MSSTVDEIKLSKQRIREILDILENYYDPKTGKIDGVKLMRDAKEGAKQHLEDQKRV